MRLRIALSKGELWEPTLRMFGKAGYSVDELLSGSSRKLSYRIETDKIDYLVCRPTDVPVYIEHGAADIGVLGKDTLLEQGKNIYELLDLGFGGCRFVLAEPEGGHEMSVQSYDHLGHLRVATKYPRVTEDYFSKMGVQVEVIKLHGNVELAPLVGLAEQIVDLASSGRTLSENKLRIVDTIAECTARLVANPVSMRIKFERMNEFTERVKTARDSALASRG